MSNDVTLLKVFANRDTYDQYFDSIILDYLEWEIRDILLSYQKYFKEHETEVINFDNFFTWFSHVYKPHMPEEQYKVFKLLIDKIAEADEIVAEQVVRKFHELQTAEKIREHLEKGLDTEYVGDLLDDFSKLTFSVEEDPDIIINDLDTVLSFVERKDGLRWKLDCLNETIGPLSKGMFVIVAAYVDVGKTIFGISESSHMARQLEDNYVLWLNNEEEDHRVIEKMWRSTLGLSTSQLIAHKKQADEEYAKRMHNDKNRIKFINIRNKSIADIKKLFKKYKPKLAVIDQTDKIINKGHKSFSDYDRLKNLYGEIRALANEYCPIIGISQADATTVYYDRETGDMKYQLYPHHRQLDGSKVGKPGEADAIIMIGKRDGVENTRGLHVSKNKFGNTMKKEVLFNGSQARYENPK